MRIVSSKTNLIKSINISMKAVPSKTTMPIMECIYIQAEGDKITFTSNDGEMAIQTTLEGRVEKSGHVAVEAKKFFEMIRSMPDDDIYITVGEDYGVSIDCGRAHFSISGKEGEDFSGIPAVAKSNYVSLSQFSLKEIIRQTIFSISETENNHMMAGECMEIIGNRMQLSSLDGYRVSIRKILLSDNYGDNKVIIAGKALSDICKIISGGVDDEILLFFTKNYIMFEFDDTIVVSRLIEGEYFKLSAMIQKDYETKVTVNKRDLLGCIERSQVLVKESDIKPIIMNIEDGKMSILLKSSMGTFNEEIDIEKTGKDLMIGFTPSYLADALKAIDDEEISIYMQNSRRPAYICDDADSYLYYILPLNFNV